MSAACPLFLVEAVEGGWRVSEYRDSLLHATGKTRKFTRAKDVATYLDAVRGDHEVAEEAFSYGGTA